MGSLLFGDDQDLDIIDDLGDDMGLNLMCPEDPEGTKEALDSGLLYAKFDDLLAQEPFDEWAAFTMVLLGAAAMEIGAKIEPKYMNILRGTYPRARMCPEKLVQFKFSLDTYTNNGNSWQEYAGDLLVTAALHHDHQWFSTQ